VTAKKINNHWNEIKSLNQDVDISSKMLEIHCNIDICFIAKSYDVYFTIKCNVVPLFADWCPNEIVQGC